MDGPTPETWDLEDDSLEVPISALEHYSYCPRQCALIHVEQTFDENVYTIRGKLQHERVDAGDDRAERGVRVVRGMPLWSDRSDCGVRRTWSNSGQKGLTPSSTRAGPIAGLMPICNSARRPLAEKRYWD